MPVPPELPGFYFDQARNRYFPIPRGFVRTRFIPPQNQVSPTTQVPNKPKKGIRISRVLYHRELYGKGSLQEECKKMMVSKPKIWEYPDVWKDADGSLVQIPIIVETPEGQCASDALLTGSTNKSLSLYDVGNVGQYFSHGQLTSAKFVGPERDETDSYDTLKDIWKYNGSTYVPSSVSSISTPKNDHFGAYNNSSPLQRALITTLGSERSGGELFILNLADPVNISSDWIAVGGLRKLVSLDCTVWGAKISQCGRSAVVGTSQGVTLADLESRQSTTLCHSKSDVLSVQLLQSGNVALCGLRNGAILTVDARLRESQRPLARHKFSYPSSNSNKPASRSRSWFVVKGYIQPSSTAYMSSSVCCLKSLQMDDQYFLASSMDGSIKLYDHRLIKRGPVQFYEGHVNSHSRIQLAIDPSESFFISGGQDRNVRIWSIKSGKMLFEQRLTSSVPMSVCWQRSPGLFDGSGRSDESQYKRTYNSDAWLGSADELLRMQFCI